MKRLILRFGPLGLVLVGSPVLAQDGTQVPEASSAMLFALGVLGVIVGRRASMRSRKDGEGEA